MKYILLILTISFAFIQLHAQTPRDSNPTGWFTVDEYQGCPPFTVKMETTKCPATTGCSVIADDDLSQTKPISNTAPVTFTFNDLGIHKLQLITDQGTGGSVQVKVLPGTAPDFNIYSCNNNRALINITDSNFDHYKIQYPPSERMVVVEGAPPFIIALPSGQDNIKVTGYNLDSDTSQCLTNTQTVISQAALDAPTINQLMVASDKEIDLSFPISPAQTYTQYQLDINTNGNTFTPFMNLYGQNNATITGISADNNYYCFRLTPFDQCTKTRSTQQSNTICSIRFRDQDVVVGNKVNTLTWLTAQPDANFTIKRTPDADDASVAQTYQHQPVNCGVVYTYQIISDYSVGAKSYSLTKQATGNSTDPPTELDNISVSLNEDATTASLLWDAGVQATEYYVFRNQSQLTTTTDLSLTDNKYGVNDCYEISYKDVCGNTSAKKEACPIILTYTLNDDNSIQFNWNDYNGWKNSVAAFELQSYSSSGDLIGTVSGPATSYHDTGSEAQMLLYRVTGKPNDSGLPDVLSNVVVVIKDPHIYYPTAFSPDSHTAMNRTFKVFGKYIESFEMQIFDRWGEMIFATNDKDTGWDGTHSGVPAPEGVYAFIARITDSAGQKITKTGSVALIRKK